MKPIKIACWESVGRTAVRAAAVLLAFAPAVASAGDPVAGDRQGCPEIIIRVPASVEPPLTIERRELVRAIHALAELMREDRVRKDNAEDETVIVTTNFSGRCRPDGAGWSMTVVPMAASARSR
jgi:hypothetical protein